MYTELVKYIPRLQSRTKKDDMTNIGFVAWNLSITFPQTIDPTATAPLCSADIRATSPIPLPRNMTYNGITVLNPWAVICAGIKYHIHRLVFCIGLDIQGLVIIV
jgi:hypothetical protein